MAGKIDNMVPWVPKTASIPIYVEAGEWAAELTIKQATGKAFRGIVPPNALADVFVRQSIRIVDAAISKAKLLPPVK